MNSEIIRATFAAADMREPKALTAFFAPDIRFRFGNEPIIQGMAAVEAALETFYDYVKQLRHEIVGIHQADDVWAIETIPHYVDVYGRAFQFPACNLMTARGNLFSEYKIFVDNSIMFQPPAAA